MNANWLSKNLFRNYPIKGVSNSNPSSTESTLLSLEGVTIPTNFISAIKLTTTIDYIDVYISRVYVINNYVCITLACGNSLYLGSFMGFIEEDFQVLTLSTEENKAYGILVFGQIESLAGLSGAYNFNKSVALLEDSVITVAPIPALTSITVGNTKFTGDIKFSYDNVVMKDVVDSPVNTINLDVVNKRPLYSRGDISSVLGNCKNPTIASINGVPPDENGNIDIYSIAPVNLIYAYQHNKFNLGTSGITIKDVCGTKTEYRVPITEANTMTYHDQLAQVTQLRETPKITPEWKTWKHSK